MRHPRFTPKQLCAFIAVAETLNFRRASEYLSLSSSAVCQLVGELESITGLKLFDRTTRSVTLSPAGQEFLPSATSVLKQMNLAQGVADNIRNRATGVVRIAAPMIFASTVLPAIIKSYMTEKPKVVIQIHDAAVDNLVNMVSQGSVELAVGSDQNVGPDVARTDLFSSPWVLWCAPTHPLASQGELAWSQLNDQSLVVAGRDYERTVSLTYQGFDEDELITPVNIVDNISTALGIAAQGSAATLAPAYIGLFARLLGLVMLPLSRPTVKRKVCLYSSLNRSVSPAAAGFGEYLEEWLKTKYELGSKGFLPPAEMTCSPLINTPRC